MEAAGEEEYHLLPDEPQRQLRRLDRLPDKLRQVGFFFILIGTSLIIQDSDDVMTAFGVFIIGVWLIMLSLALPMAMAPMEAVHVLPALMEMLQMYVFGFRVDLLF